ncbi:HupE/UreJ family protein [Pacificimonas sp. WHA3]|uniref:HupE/UreJ family protein n=1 Tax=Pacificimonas pallii TaxID=2827236 RepID=A0ABS6SIG6_9SPHN|nr:HupE/UreJ family protein [Pacificimonas pallii]MBV7257853.1 HupE/UreJ family protein [Pacificimonas pallii]
MIVRWWLAMALLAVAAVAAAHAHEVRPAYLEVTATQDGVYDVLWKQPVLDGRRLSLTPEFGPACEAVSPKRQAGAVGAVVERWRIHCARPLSSVGVAGLDRTLTDVFLRVTAPGGEVRSALLKPAAAHLDMTQTRASPAFSYLALGIEHILLGPDHLLFVAGLVLLLAGWRRIAIAATAFTAAHSITLALSALGQISLPGRPVEIMIAASILMIAAEIMRARRGRPSLISRHPWPIIFGIGLVHGLGFAGALAEIGLPAGEEASALIFFNIGIEIGQLLFVAGLLLILVLVAHIGNRLHRGATLLMTYCIGIAGAFWTIERLFLQYWRS